MPRKTESYTGDVSLTAEEWLAQEPCPGCGGRPGYNPLTGTRLVIKSMAGPDYVEGHTYNCQQRPQ